MGAFPLRVLSPFPEAPVDFFEADNRGLGSWHTFLRAGGPAVERPYQLSAVDLMQACRKLTME
jgi:hypothetical protein